MWPHAQDMLLRSLMPFPAFHRLASLSSLLTAIPGNAAKLTGVFEANFVVLMSMLALWPLRARHHLVAGTFSHLWHKNNLYSFPRMKDFCRFKLSTHTVLCT